MYTLMMVLMVVLWWWYSELVTSRIFFIGVTEVESLHIINATLDVLNLENKAWKGLKSMSMTDGSIKRVVGMFPSITSIQCFNLSNNGIMDIDKNSLTFLHNLTTLDLSSNKLEIIPKIFTKQYNLSIDISSKETSFRSDRHLQSRTVLITTFNFF